MSDVFVGEVRPSQLLWAYGPGAMVDLPNMTVMVKGLDEWDQSKCTLLTEPRLLAVVKRRLGGQVGKLLSPPVIADDGPGRNPRELPDGVPVTLFPRWLRCTRCNFLGSYDLGGGVFELKSGSRYRPENTRLAHATCRATTARYRPLAVPARFVVACEHGHLDDFPWSWFVHRGLSACSGQLEFHESGAATQARNIIVRCVECGAERPMADAFGSEAARSLPGCRGRHPHLFNYREECGLPLRTLVLGASNTWFPISLSVLSMPDPGGAVRAAVEAMWDSVKLATSRDVLTIVLQALESSHSLGPLGDVCQPSAGIGMEEVWQEVERRRKALAASATDSGRSSKKKKAQNDQPLDLKGPEWSFLKNVERLTEANFSCRTEPVPPEYAGQLEKVLLLDRLRQVNALVGFTRVEPPEDAAAGEAGEGVTIAPLSASRPTWVPAVEVHGEGIFLQFSESVLQAWERRPAVQQRAASLHNAHTTWRKKMKRPKPAEKWPGARFVLLHTLAHLLIREFSLECGYSMASIRERIYATSPADPPNSGSAEPKEPMAGILLYTAEADSDGTLGGLVEMGRTEKLGRLLKGALRRAATCSSDPLCSEHQPGSEQDLTVHGAACHACAFAPETSCEAANRYLDRALVVPVFNGDPTMAFFRGLP